ncbi:MAG: hypothetical protein ABEL76_03880 [Bradymonadaceae bacterium]
MCSTALEEGTEIDPADSDSSAESAQDDRSSTPEQVPGEDEQFESDDEWGGLLDDSDLESTRKEPSEAGSESTAEEPKPRYSSQGENGDTEEPEKPDPSASTGGRRLPTPNETPVAGRGEADSNVGEMFEGAEERVDDIFEDPSQSGAQTTEPALADEPDEEAFESGLSGLRGQSEARWSGPDFPEEPEERDEPGGSGGSGIVRLPDDSDAVEDGEVEGAGTVSSTAEDVDESDDTSGSESTVVGANTYMLGAEESESTAAASLSEGAPPGAGPAESDESVPAGEEESAEGVVESPESTDQRSGPTVDEEVDAPSSEGPEMSGGESEPVEIEDQHPPSPGEDEESSEPAVASSEPVPSAAEPRRGATGEASESDEVCEEERAPTSEPDEEGAEGEPDDTTRRTILIVAAGACALAVAAVDATTAVAGPVETSLFAVEALAGVVLLASPAVFSSGAGSGIHTTAGVGLLAAAGAHLALGAIPVAMLVALVVGGCASLWVGMSSRSDVR